MSKAELSAAKISWGQTMAKQKCEKQKYPNQNMWERSESSKKRASPPQQPSTANPIARRFSRLFSTFLFFWFSASNSLKLEPLNQWQHTESSSTWALMIHFKGELTIWRYFFLFHLISDKLVGRKKPRPATLTTIYNQIINWCIMWLACQ